MQWSGPSAPLGKVGEEFAPFYLVEELGVNPKNFKHIGTPVDYIAFKGLSDNDMESEIIFVEVKTGQTCCKKRSDGYSKTSDHRT